MLFVNKTRCTAKTIIHGNKSLPSGSSKNQGYFLVPRVLLGTQKNTNTSKLLSKILR